MDVSRQPAMISRCLRAVPARATAPELRLGEGRSMASTPSYESVHIQVLSPIEAVRRRPAMYIGGVDTTAMHNLLWALVSNSIDDHLATRRDGYVRIRIEGERAIVEDNGRGIPVTDDAGDRLLLERLMTTLHAGSHGRPH